MNQTHVLYIFDNHLLHPLQKPIPSIPLFFLHKGNCQRQQLSVTISCNSCEDCAFIPSCQKCPIYTNDWPAVRKRLNASAQGQERPLKYLLSRLLGTWICFQVVVATRISKTYSVQQCRHIVIRSFIRPPPHLQCFLFHSVSFVVANFIFKLLLNSTND